MSHVLIATIGTNDVHPAIRGGEPEHGYEYREDARVQGQKLLNTLKTRRVPDNHLDDWYDVPILLPIVSDLIARAATPDRIVLIATDQPEGSAEDAERNKDTLFYARLIKRRLACIPKLADIKIRIRHCKRNPADYDQAFTYLRHVLRRMRGALAADARRDTHWHLAAVGGTPALTTALIIEGVAAFGSDASILYQGRKEATPRELDIGVHLRAGIVRDALATDIAATAFAPALALLDTTKERVRAYLLPDEKEPAFRALLEHGLHRLNADLAAARAALVRLPTDLAPYATDTEAAALALPDPAADPRERDGQTLREIIAAARLSLRHGRYYDFLARADTFHELAWEFLSDHIFAITLNDHTAPDGKTTRVIADWLQGQPEAVQTALASWSMKNLVQKRRRDDCFAAVMKAVLADSPTTEQCHAHPQFTVWNERYDPIRLLRNDALHDYGGLTIHTLRGAWGDDEETIITEMEALATAFGIPHVTEEKDPYTALQAILRRLIGAA